MRGRQPLDSLAQEGAKVYASDISAKMVEEAQSRAQDTLNGENLPTFEVKDLEELAGRYHTVICLDVLIHYPKDKVEGMISHLSSLAESRLILSFAPKTPCYTLLKKIGEFFLAPAKPPVPTSIAKPTLWPFWRLAAGKLSAAP